MKNLFAENRLVFMGGPEKRNSSETLKSAAELPGTKELSYGIAKKLIKITKSGEDVSADPNRLIKFIRSSNSTKKSVASRFLKTYAKTEGYKLSKSDIASKSKKLADFYNPRKNRNLRANVKQFMKNAVDDSMTSASEMKEMKKMVGKFASKTTNAMRKVIDSRSVQSVTERGKGSNNRATVVKKYVGSFRAALKGTNINIVASASKIEAKISDVAKTAKAIKSPTKRSAILKKILSYKKA